METVENGNTSLGNTKARDVSFGGKARAYQLTLNEVERYDELKDYLTGLKATDYYIACKEEAPTTGHEHIHIYVHFNNARKLSIKKCCNAHIEVCRGTPQQNIDYILKDGNVIDEIGKRPHQGGYNIKDLKKLSNDELEELPAIYYNTVKKIQDERNKVFTIKDFRKQTKIYYIFGPSGVGKTNKALDIIEEHKELSETFNIVKYENNFWLGASETEKIALYDDFRDSHLKASEFINFIDYNKHFMNIKGGSIKNNYELVIITSVQSPYTIYRNMEDEPRKQWLRRMEIINLGKETIEEQINMLIDD
ncbi:replication associated protein [Chicken virus mg5_2876]|uniref:Replication-associated protein n=1 Tax=Chicken virus mg5_2876 TaxID=2720907 RepID=A0AAE6XNM5_9VIRU|nr:replication associated protein [Chicken virus mg5_2876]QIR82205.1 replication associated protein [Chicken virus mg5_2876]